MTNSTVANDLALRGITRRTRGHGHGPITRLMSPSDLGHVVKPFVFLDIFDANKATIGAMSEMPLHPHSGIATVTVFTEGYMHYNDPAIGSGVLEYGGVEWMRAGGGVWHGKELSPGNVDRIQGFQLWIALPPDLENTAPVSNYVEARDMARAGPAHVILGKYKGTRSPLSASAPAGINYLLVTLQPGEKWAYRPPEGHAVGWLALAKGKLRADTPIDAGEMVIFEQAETPIALEAAGAGEAVFVLGSAVPHPHPLHLGYYSVHTSAQALAAGESRIAELGRKLQEAGDRRTQSGTIPVFR
ncbi:pirin family protein [Tsuneonella sp. CC-YZS046]|uniref:pirin family protein n=1 Tax=Tsuneonella sp. CC-YZS046 TaxID=3042152 RepID=UPI002D773FCB|nr:pirin family protein [Tsuneonella sp. CC-YZS046]WRO67741.1 pirin family protein [Tsuneonella sp. CC-YZS046]